MDGWLRYHAHERLGRAAIACDVRAGGRREARLFVASSNAGHGLQRTVADNRLSVLMVLGEQPSWTVAQVASHCRVSVPLVTGIIEVKRRMPAVSADGVTDTGSRELLGKPMPAPRPGPLHGKPRALEQVPAPVNPWVGAMDKPAADFSPVPKVAPPPAPARARYDDEDGEDEAVLDRVQLHERMSRSFGVAIRYAQRLGVEELHELLDEVIADMKVRQEKARRRGRPVEPGDSPLQPDEGDE